MPKKLVTIKALIAEIEDKVSNPLSVILNIAEGNSPPGKEELQKIVKQVKKIDNSLRKILH